MTQMLNIVKVLTPINLREEKEKFFQSSRYHPQFRYSFAKEVVPIPPDDYYYHLHEALIKQNHEEIMKHASVVFKIALHPQLLTMAHEITKITPHPLETPQETVVIKAFENVFSFFDLNYRIEILDQHGFNFRPQSAKKILTASKYLNLQFFSLESEIRHELVHILRYENGQANEIVARSDYLPTEEGLASYLQDYKGDEKNNSLFQHAAEYVASSIGIHGSLRDIVDYFLSIGFNPDLAWQRGVRHKFGFIDTRKPGDILKPAMYFSHEDMIKNLNTESIIKLFIGKITLSELENIQEYSGKIPEEKIRSFYTD